MATTPSTVFAQSVAADSAGNVVIAGTFSPLLDFGCGPRPAKLGSDIFVAKLAP